MQVCPSSNAGVPPIPPSLTYVPLSKVLPARPCARPSNLTRAPPHPRTLPAHYPRALTSRVPLRNSWWLLRCSGFPYFTLLLLAEPASSSGAALGATGAGAATAPTTVAARSTGSFCTTGAGCCAFCRCHSFSPIKAKKETPLKPTTMPPISMPVERVCRGGGGAAAASADTLDRHAYRRHRRRLERGLLLGFYRAEAVAATEGAAASPGRAEATRRPRGDRRRRGGCAGAGRAQSCAGAGGWLSE
uniref:Uncharacterized protein n=1 Tax=Calcidiscus leptoporus TaxID=127549 RepID=A0A7S0J8X5_9EUKA|mmetsp:Transcript_43923/g.102685  ORF Transcript_43923/g.102685 Transcript_43923/m.102685 type:complete len:246 (+) Transcript_43923:404-1141(+)